MALDALLHRPQPSPLQQLLADPGNVFAAFLQEKRSQILSDRTEIPTSHAISVICISDTHNHRVPLPPGDLLIHAGDLTQAGTHAELQSQLDWINGQPHAYKVVVAGNHDTGLERADETNSRLRWGSIVYLKDTSVRLRFRGGRSLLVYGSPWTRKHGNWAFQYESGVDMFSGSCDEETDVIVTHSPPRHHLDLDGLGDDFLLQEIHRVRPKLHIFGHIHGGYGRQQIAFDRFQTLHERLCAGASVLHAFEMVLILIYWLMLGSRIARSEHSTCLVNASILGGPRDDVERAPHVVLL